MDEKKILGTALSFYGCEIQQVIAIEELSELQKELCKSLRSGADRPHISEEIADVQIMLEQMMLLYEGFALNYGRRTGGKIKADYYWSNAVKSTWDRANKAMTDKAAEIINSNR